MLEPLKRLWRTVSTSDIWSLASTGQKIRLLASSVVSTLLETSSKLLGPMALAQAVDMLAQDEVEIEVLGVVLSREHILYASVALTLANLSIPEVRKFFLYGIEEEASKKLSERLIYRSQHLVSNLPKNLLGRELYQPLNKNLYVVNSSIPKLLAISTGSIQPLLFDIIFGTTVTFMRFGKPVGSVLAGYIVLAIVINEFILYLTNTAERSEKTKSLFSKFSRAWIEVLQCSETVTLLGRQELEIRNISKIYAEYHGMQRGNALREQLSILQIVLIALVQFFGAYYVTRDDLQHLAISDVVFLLGYVANIARSINTINSSFRSASDAVKGLDKIYEFLGDEKREFPKNSREFFYPNDESNVNVFIGESTKQEECRALIQADKPRLSYEHSFFGAPKISGIAIEFKNVSFYYNSSEPILDSVSFKIPAGKTTAIVGFSNAGKTTITKLICGLIKPINTDAEIKIFGRNIKDMPLNELRQIVGIMRQQTETFKEDSSAYNIYYGFSTEQHLYGMKHPDESDIGAEEESLLDNELQSAASRAKVTHLLSRDPVGELCGGENQRLGIARILGRRSNILVFDEPTSQLDSVTEYEVLKSIRKVAIGKTVVMVAHRLSTIMDADQILVLMKENNSSGATVVEQGTHQELLEKNGTYAQFWKLQTGQIRQLKL